MVLGNYSQGRLLCTQSEAKLRTLTDSSWSPVELSVEEDGDTESECETHGARERVVYNALKVANMRQFWAGMGSYLKAIKQRATLV